MAWTNIDLKALSAQGPRYTLDGGGTGRKIDGETFSARFGGGSKSMAFNIHPSIAKGTP